MFVCEGCTAATTAVPVMSTVSCDIVACARCGLAATLPRLSIEESVALHGQDYFGPRGGRRFPAPIETIIAAARSGRARRMAALLPPGGRILDVGCGRGLMLRQLAACGYEAYGVDVSPLAGVMRTPPPGVRVRLGVLTDLDWPDAYYDVVTFFHSLEHVVDLSRTLDTVARLLRPGGSLVVAAPDFSSLQARLGMAAWLHLELPQHRHHFTPNTLEIALAQRGLRVKMVSRYSPEFDPIAVLQTALNRIGRPHNAFFDALRGVRKAPLDLLLGAILVPAAVAATLTEYALTGGGGTFEAIARREVS